ncbi:hypothetical protein D910_09847 [Dendroctonus ponderosae]|uniref:DnaJ homolog subfamily C member 10 n=1 Tax=Dendroctonus ponderosae TaxID=77166 RepID=U4UEY1_DENPD|nr:hypothetical protein D910_09847 [Dendroctonus ponderosae]
MNSRNVILYVVLFCLYSLTNCDEKVDYYKLLNVPRDATVQEVRKAFKILAVKLHPDKNKDDSDAEQKFIQLAKAYEILKDPTSRKEYDLHGDSEFNNNKRSYHSYSYYKDHFGIYDDDPIIVTLSKQDYELNILDVNQAWFVNFYSPHCHHCHEMAPIWRKLASQLEGVVRIAAVNCEEDYPLCYQLSIEAYPTLLFYEKEAHIYDGEKFRGSKTLEALEEYILSKVHVNIEDIDQNNWPLLKQKQWVLFLCSNDNYNCPEKDTITKISATLEGLLSVGIVKDSELCEKISESFKKQPIIFWQIDATNIPEVHIVEGSDSKEILDKILNILPTPPLLDEKKFHGGAFEVHQGRDVLHEVASFARDSTKSTNLHALSPADFHNLMEVGTPWYIDWYAPWCPPCKRLTPELRKASQHFEPDVVQFGTVDCTLHRELCFSQSISSYPTMVLYNRSSVQRFQGVPNEGSIVEFIQDAINPLVKQLDENNFSLLARKSAQEMWVVDFFAPWCGPCQQLAPEYRKLAKSVAELKNIVIAQVDCVANEELCSSQNIRGYPTIRLYPLGSKGLSTVAIHNGHRDAVSLKRWIIGFLPSKVDSLTETEFKEQILTENFYLPWLVDFYAPWCSHCVHFEPEFRTVAQRLDGKVRSAKIDCEAHRIFCGYQGVSGYPAVRLYMSPQKHFEIDSQNANEIIQKVKYLLEKHKRSYSHDEL